MPHYKDINNNLHFLDDVKFIYHLPSGVVEITDEEAETIRASQISPISQVPQQITRYQGVCMLDAWQLLDEAEAYIAAEDTPKRIKLAWNTILHFEYGSDMILTFTEKFGLTQEQVDQFFIQGAKIN